MTACIVCDSDVRAPRLGEETCSVFCMVYAGGCSGDAAPDEIAEACVDTLLVQYRHAPELERILGVDSRLLNLVEGLRTLADWLARDLERPS